MTSDQDETTVKQTEIEDKRLEDERTREREKERGRERERWPWKRKRERRAMERGYIEARGMWHSMRVNNDNA